MGRRLAFIVRSAARLVIAMATALGVRPAPVAHPGPSPCERAFAHPEAADAEAGCVASAARRGEDHERARLAHLRLIQGRYDEAAATARALLGGPRHADGHRLLCEILTRDAHAAVAYGHGVQAYLLGLIGDDPRGMLGAALCRSQSAWRVGWLGLAVTDAHEAIRIASQLEEPGTEISALIALGDALRRMGALTEARRALEAAVERGAAPCDRAWSLLKDGMLQEESEQPSLAERAYDDADVANQVCGSPDIAGSLLLNRAYLRARDAPAEASALLDQYVARYGDVVEALLLEGIIAANQGDRATADRLLDEAGRRRPPDADWAWEIERVRAELAASLHTPAGDGDAERHFLRSIALIEELRAATPSRSAFLLSSHRAPYDGLIALRARQQRWRDALAVVLALDAGDMLDAAGLPPGLRPAARPSASVEAALAAWQGRELVIVLAPSPRRVGAEPDPVVQLQVLDGEVTGRVLGSADQARAAAERAFSDPDDAVAMRAIGRLLEPDPTRTDTLHVLAIGALGRVPLAALQDDTGALIIARRPVARMLSIQPRAAGPETTERAVVIADPRGDLFWARIEGQLVAELVGRGLVVTRIGSTQATRANLEDARHAALLHLATHIAGGDPWHAVQLADGDLTAAELVGLQLAPAVAVLASCGSGATRDDEGWGSIASALLTSGTSAVIATDRSVGDVAALRLVAALYREPDVVRDPVAALARVQRDAARRGEPAAEWAAFGVLRAPPPPRSPS